MADDFVRDMPIDYTLLVENVADPDHGVFAHQTPIFDSFAASSDHPLTVGSEPGRAGADKVRRCCHAWRFVSYHIHNSACIYSVILSV